MSTYKKSAQRWILILCYLGALVLTISCMGTAVGTTNVDDVTLRIDDNVIQVKDENGDWSPVAGPATFELVGELESTDPWTVAGMTLETNDMTQIEEGLQVGDLVRVRGTVLEDETWVAYSIEKAEGQTDPIIILIGVVNSVDPWVVNGIGLNVTDGTDIQGEITPGMLVRVAILLLPDGTWEILNIAPLGESTEVSGCATVVATVVSVGGDEIQFLGWPVAVKFGSDIQTDNRSDKNDDGQAGEEDNDDENEIENGDDTEIVGTGDVVVAVVCISDDGSMIIVQIILLDADEEGEPPTGTEGGKVLVCHKPDKKGGHTLSLPQSAVPAHLGHGDKLGACP